MTWNGFPFTFENLVLLGAVGAIGGGVIYIAIDALGLPPNDAQVVEPLPATEPKPTLYPGLILACSLAAVVVTLLLGIWVSHFLTHWYIVTGLFAIGSAASAFHVWSGVYVHPYFVISRKLSLIGSPHHPEPCELNLPHGMIGDAYRELYAQEWRPTALPARPPFTWNKNSTRWVEWNAEFEKVISRDADKVVNFYWAQAWQTQRLFEGLVPSTPGPFRIPLIDTVPNLRYALKEILDPFWSDEALEIGVGHSLRRVVDANQEAISIRALSEAELKKGKLATLFDFKGSQAEVVEVFMAGTGFEHLFKGEVEYGYQDPRTRFEHVWIVAPPGSGKTTLMQTMLAEDLQAAAAGRCSVIIIDSQRVLIDTIRSLSMFDRTRLDVIDPDPTEDLSINPLMMEGVNVDTAVELLQYILGGLGGAEMTPKQDGLFKALVPTLLNTGATLATMHGILSGTIKPDFSNADPITKAYMETGGFQRDKETREQVEWRLRRLFGNEVMRRILAQPHNDLDFDRFMNTPGVTVVSTNQKILGTIQREFLGRYCIAQILRYGKQRNGDGTDLPCFVYIDECAEYIKNDTNITELLDHIRKQQVGLILAHQRLSHLSSEVYGALAVDVGTIIAGATNEAGAMAKLMGETNPKLIADCDVGEFALYIRRQMRRGGAIPVRVQAGLLEAMPKRTYVPKPRKQRAAPSVQTAAPLAPIPAETAPKPEPKAEGEIDLTPTNKL